MESIHKHGINHSQKCYIGECIQTQAKYNFHKIFYSIFRKILKHQVPLWYKGQMEGFWGKLKGRKYGTQGLTLL